MKEILSLGNELIKKYSSLKNKKYRDLYNLFILDDYDLIKEASSKNLLEAILFSKPFNFKVNDNCLIIKTNDQIINKISNVENPNGIVGICKKFDYSKEYSNKIVALDRVQDPGNGGTILRSALAFNYNTMIVSTDSFDIYNDKFIRASKGSIFNINIIKEDLVSSLKDLKKKGYKIVVADLNKDATKVNDFITPNKVVLVLGNEGNGISKYILKLADEIVYIPISSKMESLNVSIAASIIMSKNVID